VCRLPTSDFHEDSGINPDILDCAGRRPDAEVVPLEQLAQAVAVDEVDRRGAVAGGFLLGVRSERARGDQRALVAPPCFPCQKQPTVTDNREYSRAFTQPLSCRYPVPEDGSRQPDKGEVGGSSPPN